MVRRLYDSRAWKRRARLQIKHQPLCAMCLAEGRGAVRACVADHVIPHNNDPSLFIRGELQSLCSNCHNSRKKKAENIERRGYDKRVGSDGWPVDPRHPCYTGVIK
jgi:5-methylcytosine-specific restriction endonuclease McrA